MTEQFGRQVELVVDYNYQSITKDLEYHLTGWSFTDNMSGSADDLSIRVEDTDAVWSGPYMPRKGDWLQANIYFRYFREKHDKMKLGQFEIDEIELYSDPATVNIKGLSIPETSAIRGERKSKAWEKTNLKNIASDIAKKNGMKLYFDSAENPEYDRMDQGGETDISFLMRICIDAGLCLKVANRQVVIFDERKYERMETKGKIEKGHPSIKRYSARSTINKVYRACRVHYMDPMNKQKIDYTFTPPNAPKTGRVLIINEQVSNIKEAQKLAKARLRQENKEANVFSIVFTDFHPFFASTTWDLKGFGGFDGKYIITKSTFEESNGLEITVDFRKCLEGY